MLRYQWFREYTSPQEPGIKSLLGVEDGGRDRFNIPQKNKFLYNKQWWNINAQKRNSYLVKSGLVLVVK